MQPWLGWNSLSRLKEKIYLPLPSSAEIKGLYHHSQLKLLLKIGTIGL